MEIRISSQRLEIFLSGFYEVLENEGIAYVVGGYKAKVVVVEIYIAIWMLVSTPWVGRFDCAVQPTRIGSASSAMGKYIQGYPHLGPVIVDEEDGEGALYCAVSMKSIVS